MALVVPRATVTDGRLFKLTNKIWMKKSNNQTKPDVAKSQEVKAHPYSTVVSMIFPLANVLRPKKVMDSMLQVCIERVPQGVSGRSR